MPIYEYACQQCQHQFETKQSMQEMPLKRCPQCGRDSLEKLISATNFQLKGSGWYVSDYKKATTSPADSASSKDNSVVKEEGSNKKEVSTSGNTEV